MDVPHDRRKDYPGGDSYQGVSDYGIVQLPDVALYALDSVYIFDHNKTQELARDWLGLASNHHGFEPEWKLALPEDKKVPPIPIGGGQ